MNLSKPIDPYEALEAIDTGNRPAWWHYGPMDDQLFITHVAQMALASRPAREAAIAELVAAGNEIVPTVESIESRDACVADWERHDAAMARFRAALAAMEGKA